MQQPPSGCACLQIPCLGAQAKPSQRNTTALLRLPLLRLSSSQQRQEGDRLLHLPSSRQRQEGKTIISVAGAPPPPPPPATAMDRFPDGAHVCLRSPVRGEYLFADDDGSGVSVSRSHGRAMLNAAWRVERVVWRDGKLCFLLQSAAYGRYLALSPSMPLHGHRGRPAILRDYQEPRQRSIRWRAVGAGDGSEDVLLCTLEDKERYLRAHGSLSRPCSCITIDSRRSTMTHWTVVQIPPRPAPPALPTPSKDLECRNDRYRKIQCTQANHQGNFIREPTFRLKFSGRSVFKLRSEVAKELGEEMSEITVCVQAGCYGRLTPLVVDLPRNEEPLDIIILRTSSTEAKALVHPNIGPGIELLTDGAFVRLTCSIRGQCCYLHAKGDGVGVNLSPGPTSLQDVWAVHKLEIDGEEFVLLRSAAYGRYFALMSEGKKPGSCFAQLNYQDPEQSNLLWVATSLKGSHEVHLSSGNGDKGLDVPWTIEVVPVSLTPPLLPAPVQSKERKINTDQEILERMIWYRREDNMDINPWTTLLFEGQSLSALRSKLSNNSSLILCTRAGSCGQLTPLVTDLPDNNETMEIIILTPGSQAAQELRYPVMKPSGI